MIMENQAHIPCRYDVCPIVYSLDILGRKWKMPVICELDKHGVLRYHELKKQVHGITNMMLSQTLRELEGCGLVSRTQYNQIPPKVEYSLTEAGRSILPALFQLADWGAGQLAGAGWPSGCGKSCIQSLVPALEPVSRDPRVLDSPHFWDLGYEEIRRDLAGQEAYRGMSGLEKAKIFVCRSMLVLTQEDEEYTRMTYLTLFGFNRLCLEEADRPYFRILAQLIGEGRKDGSIRCPLSDQELTRMISSFSSGLIMKWELTRGAYALIEENQAAIDWFFAQLARPD